MPKNKQVVIHIKGGLAEIISKPKTVNITIRDFDIGDMSDDKLCKCGGQDEHFHGG